MDVASIVLTAVSVVVGVIAAWVAWLAYRSAKRSEELQTERTFVDWQIDSIGPGHFLVGNVGQDEAHEVSVQAWTSVELVEAASERMPPLPEEAGVLEIKLPKRMENGPDEPDMPRPARRPAGVPIPDDVEAMFSRTRRQLIEQQVHVQVRWRSKRGKWSEWTDTTG